MAKDLNDWVRGDNNRKLYRAYCDTCSTQLRYKKKSDTRDICRSCASKANAANHLVAPEVRKKATLSKQNKMIESGVPCDYSDYIVVSGYKRFARVCLSCGDKRYGSSAAAKQRCRKCMGRESSAKTSPNIKWDDFTDDEGSRRRYRQYCLHCNSDCGYRELKQFDSPCTSCKDKGIKRVRENRKRIKSSMKSSIYHRLRYRLANKSRKKTFDLLDFTLDELISHLESQFKPGMSWDNYGEWHIDHKTPDSWFSYDSVNHPDFKKSWALDNLQPMWAKENISKGNRFSDTL